DQHTVAVEDDKIEFAHAFLCSAWGRPKVALLAASAWRAAPFAPWLKVFLLVLILPFDRLGRDFDLVGPLVKRSPVAASAS
ncbi:MAG: hypothetical protein B7Z31_14910, partial [Rhodobacterales bacterium 12-65-15]